MSGSQACRDSPHGPFEKEMCHLKAEKNKLNHSGCLLSQILFHFLFAYIICIFFLFYYPTLSLLCMFQSYNDNLFCGWTSSCFFYRREHNYSVFCSQKQGRTKNVNANLSGNLYGATYIFFLARFARSVFKTLIKMYCTIRHKHKSVHHIVY